MPEQTENQPPQFCEACGVSLQLDALSCPACHQLVYAQQLGQMAEQAKQAEAAGDIAALRDIWQKMFRLLPVESVQAKTLAQKLAALPDPPPQGEHRNWTKLVGQLGVAGAFLWKFKVFLLLLFTKGKLLLFGLTKLSTLTSMLAFMGVYWLMFGWMFAV